MRYASILLLAALPSGWGSAEGPITIYLAGDSTMAEKLPEKRPETGWGESLQSFFDPDKVGIENHAKNGRSTRTFIEEKLWQAIIDKIKKGDYVFIAEESRRLFLQLKPGENANYPNGVEDNTHFSPVGAGIMAWPGGRGHSRTEARVDQEAQETKTSSPLASGAGRVA